MMWARAAGFVQQIDLISGFRPKGQPRDAVENAYHLPPSNA
jgi:hypothetical protein